ncbi:MAG: hypothetical protein RLZZ67_243 [Candidatus Parcubacteria bacterium]|jgi:Tfp pilus assembly protein PilN
MFTFLPEEYKKIALKEYRFRLVVLCLGLSFALFLIATAFSIPTFAIINAQKESALLERTALLNGLKEDPSLLEKEVIILNQKINLIAETSGNLTLISVIEKVPVQKGSSIALTSLSFKRGGKAGTISISGVASSRDALVSFSKRLQGEPSFSKINLPVGALARNKDIPFSLTIESAF